MSAIRGQIHILKNILKNVFTCIYFQKKKNLFTNDAKEIFISTAAF